ncbi:myosin-16 [Etheostoma spectabile]|uniref:myosin-16 n=1 Tax=Etheostoma spectabile TaxID=54343 RepID=UPI0013AF712B|nr:myosin-16-like [Etheostoma spectabile]
MTPPLTAYMSSLMKLQDVCLVIDVAQDPLASVQVLVNVCQTAPPSEFCSLQLKQQQLSNSHLNMGQIRVCLHQEVVKLSSQDESIMLAHSNEGYTKLKVSDFNVPWDSKKALSSVDIVESRSRAFTLDCTPQMECLVIDVAQDPLASVQVLVNVCQTAPPSEFCSLQLKQQQLSNSHLNMGQIRVCLHQEVVKLSSQDESIMLAHSNEGYTKLKVSDFNVPWDSKKALSSVDIVESRSRAFTLDCTPQMERIVFFLPQHFPPLFPPVHQLLTGGQVKCTSSGVALAPPTRQSSVRLCKCSLSIGSRAPRREHCQCPKFQRNREDFPASLDKLRQLIKDKVHVLQSPFTEEQQGLVCEENPGRRGLRRFTVLSKKLTFHLQQLQRKTEQELSNIHTQLLQIEGRRQLLTAELFHLQEKKKQTERELQRNSSLQTSAFQLCVCRELQTSISERLLQSERLVFQEEALSALRNLLSQDLQRYQEETQRLTSFTQKILQQSHRSDPEETLSSRQSDGSMQGKNEPEQENNMRASKYPSYKSPLSPHQTTNEEEAEQARRASYREAAAVPRSSNLHRAGSVKNLISKFSGQDPVSSSGSQQSLFSGTGQVPKAASAEALESSESKSSPSIPSSVEQDQSPVPSITVTPPLGTSQNVAQSAQRSISTSQISARIDCPVGGSFEKNNSKPSAKTKTIDSGRDSVADSGMGSESEFDSNKQSDSPSEEEPSTPRAVPTSQNPKYQLYLSNEQRINGLSGRDADGPGGGGTVGENGPRLAPWETNRLGMNYNKGSLESLTSREWDTTPDRWGVVDSPPRVFNSPYATATSMDYNPLLRMSEFKGQGGLSPATSEMNLYSYNSRSTSPVGMATSTLINPRSRFSAYDTLVKRRAEVNNTVAPIHYSMRSATLGAPNKKDYIEELTKQLDACQKRNQFLEAESVEMEKERNQIRFEMRGLLVNNEDLLRTNTQLTNEMKRMREQMIEMERESQSMGERYREMEIEVKQARDMMVEANTQEYAFNYLQQSLKNKIQDTEENLEKQTQHAKTLSEKLWLAERQLEEMEMDRETRDKRSSDLNSSILRLETELAEALQTSTQATAELGLQLKLRDEGQRRVEELEESLLEKEQELQRLQLLVSRLQGEVSGKLIDKEQTLEEEIQLRERIQLQCKQAERMVEDLRMELHSTNQAKDDLAKQVKQAQEKMIDLESDLEELHESEQRWAAKHKRSIEQTEQLQLKLIQEKDLNDQLETDKATMERQLRDLRLEVEELHSSMVQEDVISRAESRVKELENTLRTEERNKSVLTNTISKLERRINELSDQMEEEHRIATEQKDLMTQRMRSLKRQLNEAEEETSRREAQYRHTQRELAEERETNSRLQKQLLDQHLQTKRKETLTIRQTLDNLKLDLSVDDEDGDHPLPQQQTNNVTKV